MVNKSLSMSSFLALRYTEEPDVDFVEKLHYRHPLLPKDEDRIIVHTAHDINNAIERQLSEIRGGIPRSASFSQAVWIRLYWHRICQGVMRILSDS